MLPLYMSRLRARRRLCITCRLQVHSSIYVSELPPLSLLQATTLRSLVPPRPFLLWVVLAAKSGWPSSLVSTGVLVSGMCTTLLPKYWI